MLLLLWICTITFVGISSLIIDSLVQPKLYIEPLAPSNEVPGHNEWHEDDDIFEDDADFIGPVDDPEIIEPIHDENIIPPFEDIIVDNQDLIGALDDENPVTLAYDVDIIEPFDDIINDQDPIGPLDDLLLDDADFIEPPEKIF